MAAEPILDLSKIDPSAVWLDRAAIARFNPHRGHMALLDAIAWHNEELSEGAAVVHVRPDAFWTSGHIPGNPIMPGVLMIESGAQLASFLYYKRSGQNCFAGFTRIEEVAFRGQVVPGDTLLLLCKEVKYSVKRFITQIQGLVRGQIVFEGVITGMAFPNLGAVRREPIEAGVGSSRAPSGAARG